MLGVNKLAHIKSELAEAQYKALLRMSEQLVPEIQRLLAIIARDDAFVNVYVISGMGVCTIGADKYRCFDEVAKEVYWSDDDFELHEKVAGGKYCTLVQCKPKTRAAFAELGEIVEWVNNEPERQSVIPFKIFPDRVEK